MKQKFTTTWCRYLHLAWLLLLFLLQSNSTNAQSAPAPINDSANYYRQLLHCGTTPVYLAAHAVNPSQTGSNNFTTVANFPSYAIENCGKFRIYYEDKITGNPQGGFNDPAWGTIRRATLCSVLTYIQSVFDFSNVDPANPIRLYVDTSYSAAHPAPSGTGFYAQAGPLYNAAASGQIGGYVNDYVTTGIDPSANGDYHASLHVNFDAVYYQDVVSGLFVNVPIDYYNYATGSVASCQMDLFTTLLHEMGHALGCISLIQYNNPNYPVMVYGQYSKLDNNVYWGYTPGFNTKLISGGTITAPVALNNFWVGNDPAPGSFPLYSGPSNVGPVIFPQSFISHFNDQLGAYAMMGRISPGDRQDYVLGPFGIRGAMRRQYSKPELKMFNSVLGYSFTSAFAASSATVIANRPPYSTRMGNYSDYAVYGVSNFPECVPAQATIQNNTGVSYTFTFAGDPTLSDADGDPIYAYPGSIMNFRGCGNSQGSAGGDNHDQLAKITDANGNITGIKFTPRANFIGRAQFGVNLYDGKEKGSFVLYTIDVQKGNNVSIPAGTNMVLNGSFSEGTEVKTIGANEAIANTTVDMDRSQEGHFMIGHNFSDSHPFCWYTNCFDGWGGGTAIKNSSIDCGQGTILTSPAGSLGTAFPNASYPAGVSAADQRYEIIEPYSAGYYLLGDSVRKCHYYTLDFYAYAPTPIASMPVNIGFIDSVSPCGINFNNYWAQNPPNINPVKSTLPTTFTNTWTKYTIHFWHCGDPKGILYIHAAGGIGNFSQKFLIDSLSLHEELVQPQLLVNIADTVVTPCQTVKLTAVADNIACALSYTWMLNGAVVSTAASINVNYTGTAQTYTVIVNDGCRMDTASYTVPANGISVSINASYAGVPSALTASAIPAGTYTYSWTGPAGYTATGVSIGATTPGTYTVTATSAGGCSATATINLVGGGLGCNQTILQTPGTVTLSNNPSNGAMVNGTASGLLAYFGNPSNNTITTSNYILIDGTFTIDHNIRFIGCPNIVFASGYYGVYPKILVKSGHTLEISKSCKVKAACGDMWDGIYADNVTDSVIINSSEIRDMQNGVQMSNGALLNCVGNNFINNYTNLYFANTPQNSNLAVQPTYGGVILANTFTTAAGGLLAPYAGQNCKYGIYLSNTQALSIGDYNTQAYGNTFSNMSTGIYDDIHFTGSSLKQYASSIGIYNNTFQNINGGNYYGTPYSGYSLFNDPDGTAVYAKNVGAVPTTNSIAVNSTNGTISRMINCTKGVTVTGMNGVVRNLNQTDGDHGFSFSNTNGCNYLIQQDTQQNVYIGTYINGTPSSLGITYNKYTSPTQYKVLPGDFTYSTPMAAYVSYYPVLPLGAGPSLLISYNTYNIGCYTGIGIQLQNVSGSSFVEKNHINFTTNIINTNDNVPALDGIMLQACSGLQLLGNHVDGSAAAIATSRTGVAGIYMINSPKMILSCNHITNMRYGFLTVGNCSTGNQWVSSNSFNNHINGMLFRHLGTEGTFGDIGTRNNDNANSFAGNYTTIGGAFQKLYRFSVCTNNASNNIYTTYLGVNESGGNNAGCIYAQPQMGSPINFPPDCVSQNLARPAGVTDYNWAEQVARGQIEYSEFPDVALWIDQLKLYDELSNDDSARNADPVLDSFYVAAQGGALGNVDERNHQIQDMIQALGNQDMATYDQLLQAAIAANNSYSTNTMDANAAIINSIYLKYITGGLDTLTRDDSAVIANMALQCYLIGGPATLSARSLFGLYVPGQTYFDIDICNSVGAYKGGHSIFDDENNALLNQQPGTDVLLSANGFTIYPNPANATVTAKYRQSGKLELVNTLGQLMQTVALDGENSKATFNVQGYTPGVYFYRYIVGGKLMESGKLVIVQ